MLFLEYQSICQHWFRGVLSKVIIFYKYSLEQWFSTHGSQSLPNLSSSPKFRHVLTCPVVWDLLKLFISTCTQESKVVTPATIQNKYSLIKGVAFHFLPIFFLLLFFTSLLSSMYVSSGTYVYVPCANVEPVGFRIGCQMLWSWR